MAMVFLSMSGSICVGLHVVIGLGTEEQAADAPCDGPAGPAILTRGGGGAGASTSKVGGGLGAIPGAWAVACCLPELSACRISVLVLPELSISMYVTYPSLSVSVDAKIVCRSEWLAGPSCASLRSSFAIDENSSKLSLLSLSASNLCET